ncbi:MAG: Gfo/Idh/MocA family oxidoreductase [Clostridiales bacterium]|nr:Gfo/Idh/MocA family oxidoreductase [Clostridiales bacterium]
MQIKIVLVGASGYGNTYLNLLENYIDKNSYVLEAIIDPYVQNAVRYPEFKKQGIPTYDTLDQFYMNNKADLVIIASPISVHKEQVITALKNGSHVLCEKPLVPTLQDAYEIQKVMDETNRLLGVGFQWSFSNPIRRLKEDILKGIFGKPIFLKTHISWKRGDDYYNPDAWEGKIRDKRGEWVLDSIATNATAHYLHNIFFILGDSMEKSKMPKIIEGSVYRARDIESFDTCFIRGSFGDDSQFLYCATHAGEKNSDPQFIYEFEKGVVYFNQNENPNIIAKMEDGSIKDYGAPQSPDETVYKILLMMDDIRYNRKPVCGLYTVLPHLKVCNAVFDYMDITSFDEKLRIREVNPAGYVIDGLYEDSLECYHKNKLPDEMGYSWANPSVKVNLDEVSSFRGIKFK